MNFLLIVALVIVLWLLSTGKEHLTPQETEALLKAGRKCVNDGNHWIGKCIPPNQASIKCVTGGKWWVNSKCRNDDDLKKNEAIVECVNAGDLMDGGKCYTKIQYNKKVCPVCDVKFTSKILASDISGLFVLQNKFRDYPDLKDFELGMVSLQNSDLMAYTNALNRMTHAERYDAARGVLAYLKAGYASQQNETNMVNFVYPHMIILRGLVDNKSSKGDVIDVHGELCELMKVWYKK